VLTLGPLTLHGDLRYHLEQELMAIREEERQRGRPAALALAIDATVWLDYHEISLSDASNSRCVRSLRIFLAWERMRRVDQVSPETARQLASTLVAYERTLRRSVSHREVSTKPMLRGYRGLPLPFFLGNA
jgi:hypothetical protein